MKANELRIGNYIQYPNLTIPIKVSIIDTTETFTETKCKPIPLTEEWLLKFGFFKEDKSPSKNHGFYFSKCIEDCKHSFSYAYFRDDWGFYFSYTDAPNKEDDNKFDCISTGIRYVHQLQNLYFSLTGKELTLKE